MHPTRRRSGEDRASRSSNQPRNGEANLVVVAESFSDHICEGRHGFEDVDEAVVHRVEVGNRVAAVPAEVQNKIIRIDVDAPEWAAVSKVPLSTAAWG